MQLCPCRGQVGEVGREGDNCSMLLHHSVLPPASRNTRGEAEDLMTPFSFNLDPQAAAREPPHPHLIIPRLCQLLGPAVKLTSPQETEKASSGLHSALTRKAGQEPPWEWVLWLVRLAGTHCMAGSHLFLMAVPGGGKEKEGPAEDCLPALLRLKASLGGTVGKETSCPSGHLGPPTRAGSILTTLQRARGQKG